MAISNQTVKTLSATVSVGASQNTRITNLSIALANNEVSHALISNLKKIIIRSRQSAELKLSFAPGTSGTIYFTVPKNNSLELDALDFTSKSIYMQADKASVTVEILELY